MKHYIEVCLSQVEDHLDNLMMIHRPANPDQQMGKLNVVLKMNLVLTAAHQNYLHFPDYYFVHLDQWVFLSKNFLILPVLRIMKVMKHQLQLLVDLILKEINATLRFNSYFYTTYLFNFRIILLNTSN